MARSHATGGVARRPSARAPRASCTERRDNGAAAQRPHLPPTGRARRNEEAGSVRQHVGSSAAQVHRTAALRRGEIANHLLREVAGVALKTVTSPSFLDGHGKSRVHANGIKTTRAGLRRPMSCRGARRFTGTRQSRRRCGAALRALQTRPAGEQPQSHRLDLGVHRLPRFPVLGLCVQQGDFPGEEPSE